MKIAVISDIHGNFVALEAVLADLAGEADRIICLGDVAVVGPQPRKTVKCLRSLGCAVVMGNADAELLRAGAEESRQGNQSLGSRPHQEALIRWCLRQLSSEDIDYIKSFRPTVAIELGPGVSLLCFHGSPRSYDDILMSTTPVDELNRMLIGHRAEILAGGHTHVQMLRRHRDMIVLNPGSVGLPYNKNPWSGEVPREEVRLAPRAEYALIVVGSRSIGVEFRRVPLDVERVANAAVGSGRPDESEWVRSWLSSRGAS